MEVSSMSAGSTRVIGSPEKNASDVTSTTSRVDQLFEAHVEAVFNVAFRVVWNQFDAEDIVQCTFVKALTRAEQLRDRSRVRSWLLQIAYHEAIAVARRRRDVPTDPARLPDVVSLARGPEAHAVASEISRTISAAFATMNEAERMAVVLRDVEGLPMTEVASVLGIGASAAKMRVHRGRDNLRRLLANKELTDEV